jgi:hypothetical protein
MGRSTAAGSPVIAHQGSFDNSAAKDLRDAFCQGDFAILTGSADVLAFPGNTQLNGSGIDACTLATPLSGHQPAGDDGKTLFVMDNGGHAHTITTAANAIVNSKHILTFNGTVGSNVTLMAMSGVWVVVGTALGVAVS